MGGWNGRGGWGDDGEWLENNSKVGSECCPGD